MFLCCISSFAAAAEQYDFPVTNPYKATIFGTPPELVMRLAPPANGSEQRVRVEDRAIPEAFWYDADFRYTTALQSQEAPLVFVVAGTGASSSSAKMQFLTQLFYDAGYHVVAISSPTYMNFIVSMSGTRVSGYVPDDVNALYNFMLWVRGKVEEKVTVSSWSITGYSLGAMHSAYIAHLDERRQDFGFRRVVMINPPASLYDSAMIFDSWISPEALGGRTTAQLFNQVFQQFADFYRASERVKFDAEFLYRFSQAVKATDQELRGVIGLAFRLTLSSMVFTSDVCLRSGYIVPKDILLTPYSDLSPYFRAADDITFEQYIDQYLLPFLQTRNPGLTRAEAIRNTSLEPIAGYLSSNSKIRVIGNADDPILTPANLQFLRATFGNRITLFPTGGHCGNIMYGPFATKLLELMGK